MTGNVSCEGRRGPLKQEKRSLHPKDETPDAQNVDFEGTHERQGSGLQIGCRRDAKPPGGVTTFAVPTPALRCVNRQRRGIILSVKIAALFLLMCSPALGDIASCRDAYLKDGYATAFKEDPKRSLLYGPEWSR